MPRPKGPTPPPPQPDVKPPHWLAVVTLLIVGLGVAWLISYLGSTALTH